MLIVINTLTYNQTVWQRYKECGHGYILTLYRLDTDNKSNETTLGNQHYNKHAKQITRVPLSEV